MHRVAVVLFLPLLALAPAPDPRESVRAGEPAAHAATGATDMIEWDWPVIPGIVIRPFAAPTHEYGAGHRGVDLVADSGVVAHAPAAGTIAFAGIVVDRPVVTIDHGDGWVTSLEPVTATATVGTAVSAGDPIGVVARGGHAAPGTIHVGVRHHGEYVNPRLLVGEVERAILYPCC